MDESRRTTSGSTQGTAGNSRLQWSAHRPHRLSLACLLFGSSPDHHCTHPPVPLQLLTKLTMLSKGTVTPAEATVYEGYKTAVVRFETEADAKVGALQWLRNGGAVPFCSGRVGIIGSSATLNLL